VNDIEEIEWIACKDALPEVDMSTKLANDTQLAIDHPDLVGKPFATVLFCLKRAEKPICSGRYFNMDGMALRWYSLQGAAYSGRNVGWWAEMPNGPKRGRE
jgi:hypothetical protein